jgi:hypothetical protein
MFDCILCRNSKSREDKICFRQMSLKLSHFFPELIRSATKRNQESILPNFFLCKTQIFFRFLLLSLSVCSMRKYCLYFEMAKQKKQKSEKQRYQSLVGLTPGVIFTNLSSTKGKCTNQIIVFKH